MRVYLAKRGADDKFWGMWPTRKNVWACPLPASSGPLCGCCDLGQRWDFVKEVSRVVDTDMNVLACWVMKHLACHVYAKESCSRESRRVCYLRRVVSIPIKDYWA
jgi:hypothetical protein